MNPDFSPLIENLVFVVAQQQLLNYTLVLSLTLLVFDWLLTFNLEVSLVWSAPRSGTKILFLITRYLPFICMPVLMYRVLYVVVPHKQDIFSDRFVYTLPQAVCETTYRVYTFMFIISQLPAVAILTLRTWAVCGKSKLSTYGLFGVFGMLTTSVVILFGLFWRVNTFAASPVPQLVACIIISDSLLYVALVFVICMLYDGGLLLLMTVQAVYASRTAGRSELTRVVFRDGILYYIYTFGLSLINLIIMLRLSGGYRIILIPIERVAVSILACRVVLHIREQGEIESQGPTPSEQISGPMRFAQSTQRTTTDPGISGSDFEGGP